MNIQQQQQVDAVAFRNSGFQGPIAFMTPQQANFLARHLYQTTKKDHPVWDKDLASRDPLIHDIGANPRLLRAIQGLIGEDVVLWGAQFVIRKPNQLHAWHCDMESLSPAGGFVSVWIGLANTTNNTGFKLIRGSHLYGISVQESAARRGIVREGRTDDAVLRLAREHDPAAEILTPNVGDGQALLFDGRLWHGTQNSDRPRAALLLQYARADRPVRVPEQDQREWPFSFRTDVRPPVLMLTGRPNLAANRLVRPPSLRQEREIAPGAYQIDPDLTCGDGAVFTPTHCFEGRTPNCDYLECHYSVLMPGHSPHAPHQHLHEEILVVMNGEAELMLPDAENLERVVRAPAGTGAYYPAYRPHTIRNGSTAPVSYAMLKWKSASVRPERLRGQVIDSEWLRAEDSGEAKRLSTLFEGPTGFQGKLHAHTTRIAPGGGYAAHRDEHDVSIFLLEGEITVMGQRIVAPAVVFYPGGHLHDMHVSGETTARYLVWEFHKSLQGRRRRRAAVMPDAQRIRTGSPLS
jgi:uncharacterized RmlC-like cupin family protein